MIGCVIIGRFRCVVARDFDVVIGIAARAALIAPTHRPLRMETHA